MIYQHVAQGRDGVLATEIDRIIRADKVSNRSGCRSRVHGLRSPRLSCNIRATSSGESRVLTAPADTPVAPDRGRKLALTRDFPGQCGGAGEENRTPVCSLGSSPEPDFATSVGVRPVPLSAEKPL